MKGLLIKEFLGVRNNRKTYFIMCLIFAFTGIITKDINYINMTLGVMVIGQLLTNLGYDEVTDWDQFILTTSTSRKKVVLSKYIFSSLLLSITFIICILISLITIYPNTNQSIWEIISITYAVFIIIGIILSIILPIIMKFGVEKGRFGLIGIILLVAVSIVASAIIIPEEIKNKILNMTGQSIFIISILILLLGLYISYRISLKIYGNKDF